MMTFKNKKRKAMKSKSQESQYEIRSQKDPKWTTELKLMRASSLAHLGVNVGRGLWDNYVKMSKGNTMLITSLAMFQEEMLNRIKKSVKNRKSKIKN